MRTPILMAMTALAFSASPTLAQASDTDTAEVAINGTVAPLCILGEPSQGLVDLGQLIATSGSRVGRIAALGSRTVTLPDSFCNFAGSVATIEATALVETSATVATVPAGFARAVNYDATVGVWGSGSAETSTTATVDGRGATATGTSAVQGSPRLTDLVVQMSGWSAPADGLLISGDYAGLVRITLGPASVSQ